MQPTRLVGDPELSPPDLALAPNGNIVVSSERPFGAVDAVTSVLNTIRGTDTLSGFSLQVERLSSVNRAACALLPMGTSTASPCGRSRHLE
jgi:hypothetical protein